jgi:hypothetical protein
VLRKSQTLQQRDSVPDTLSERSASELQSVGATSSQILAISLLKLIEVAKNA